MYGQVQGHIKYAVVQLRKEEYSGTFFLSISTKKEIGT